MESMGGDFFQGGVSLNIIIMWGGGWNQFLLNETGGMTYFGGIFHPFPKAPSR